jgi:hypothetical protein
MIACQTRRSWTNNKDTVYIYMHILATYGKRMYINMSAVGEEWVLLRPEESTIFVWKCLYYMKM